MLREIGVKIYRHINKLALFEVREESLLKFAWNFIESADTWLVEKGNAYGNKGTHTPAASWMYIIIFIMNGTGPDACCHIGHTLKYTGCGGNIFPYHLGSELSHWVIMSAQVMKVFIAK